MARRKYQRTGRGGCNLKPCKVCYSDRHNERRANPGEIPCNPNTTIRAELTKNNTVWMDERVPSLWSLDRSIRKDYADAVRWQKVPALDSDGKAVKDERGKIIYEVNEDGTPKMREYHVEMPSKGPTAAAPLKETILNLPSNGKETDRMVQEYVSRVEELTGWKAVRYFVHRDERYDDPDTGESHFNCHAHIVWNAYSYETHRILSVGAAALRKTQDIAAAVTGLERGIDARVTRASHLTVAEYKGREERMRRYDLTERYARLAARSFDELAEIANPTTEEEKRRNALREEMESRSEAEEHFSRLHQATTAMMESIAAMMGRVKRARARISVLPWVKSRVKEQVSADDVKQEWDNVHSIRKDIEKRQQELIEQRSAIRKEGFDAGKEKGKEEAETKAKITIEARDKTIRQQDAIIKEKRDTIEANKATIKNNRETIKERDETIEANKATKTMLNGIIDSIVQFCSKDEIEAIRDTFVGKQEMLKEFDKTCREAQERQAAAIARKQVRKAVPVHGIQRRS